MMPAIGVVGGILRAAGSFAPTLIASDHVRNWLYVVIDLGLAVGVLNVYLERRHDGRTAGTIGALLALGGLIAGRIGAAVTDLNVYPVTAGAVGIGIVMLACSEWRSGRVAPWIPLTFAVSLAAGGIGMLVAGAGALFVLSGILFGGAFCALSITAS